MKFHGLFINNFLTLGQGVQLNLADRGLNIIQGENLDNTSAHSNGAGKSSIVDALCWALFGTTARGSKGDAVVNRTAKKNTSVTVQLANGVTGYVVTRYRKHATHKNQLHITAFNPVGEGFAVTGEGVRLDKGTEAESQRELEKILGCSQEVFMAAVYAGQEAMPDLPRMGDRDLKRLIEEAAGMQRIERAYAISRERMAEAKTAASMLASREGGINAAIERAQSGLDLKRRERDAWEEGRAGRVTHAEEVMTAALMRVDDVQTAFDASAALQPTITSGLAKLQASLDGFREAQRAVQAAQEVWRRLELGVRRDAVRTASVQIKAIEHNIATAAEHMGKPCRECGKPHTEAELETYLSAQRARLAEEQAGAAQLVRQVQEQMAAVEKADAEVKRLAALVPDVSDTNAAIARLHAAQHKHNNLMAELSSAKRDLAHARETVETRKAEVNPHASAVEALEAQRSAAEGELVELRLQGAELARRLAVAESVVKVFGPAGVRAQILDTVTPYLNARTADYLSVLTDGTTTAVWTTLTKMASGELKEKFSIDVTDTQGAESFTGLSGGEKRKVRLATCLALQDLMASRASQPIDLWLGDEIDDAMDDAGLERLMVLLERKARERGTVLVISHNSLADWCDAVTTVTKEGGSSRVAGALVAA